MWLFRYLLPGIFAVALGIFVAQNLNQKTAIHFLFWKFYEVPYMWIIAVTFIIGFFIRYYVIFIKWMEKKRLERTTQKIVEAHKADEDFNVKKDYTEEIKEYAEQKMKNRLEDEKTRDIKEEK